MLTQERNRIIQLLLRNRIGTGKDDRRSSLDLVIIELAKVLHIDLHLAGIDYRHCKAQSHFFIGDFFHSSDHIRKLAHAGGFDHDAVGVILIDHLRQSFTEVTNQGTANTSGIHFRDIDARILQEPAVNANFAELILDEYQLLTGIRFLDHFLDQCRLAGAQKARVNIDFCHSHTPSVLNFLCIIALRKTYDKTKKLLSSTG